MAASSGTTRSLPPRICPPFGLSTALDDSLRDESLGKIGSRGPIQQQHRKDEQKQPTELAVFVLLIVHRFKSTTIAIGLQVGDATYFEVPLQGPCTAAAKTRAL